MLISIIRFYNRVRRIVSFKNKILNKTILLSFLEIIEIALHKKVSVFLITNMYAMNILAIFIKEITQPPMASASATTTKLTENKSTSGEFYLTKKR